MLGRIYTNIKTFKPLQFINVYKIDEYVEDNNIPTLIIGKKELLDKGYSLSVLNRKIKENLYWTYTKMEKRNIHETDITAFYDLVFKKMFHNIKYDNISIYDLKFSTYKNIINILNNENIYKCIYIQKKHVYIYYENKVIGFSLDEVNYIGVDINKVVNILLTSKNNIVITKNNFIKNEVLSLIKDKEYLTPYLYIEYKNMV